MQNLQQQPGRIENLHPRSGAISAGDCISNGWNLAGQEYWLFLGMTFLAWIILFVIGIIPLLGAFISAIISGPIVAGLYYVFLRKMGGEAIDFGMMFEGFNKFLPAMVVSIIQSIPSIIYTIFNIFVLVATIGLIGFGGVAATPDLAILNTLNLVSYIMLGGVVLVGAFIQISLIFSFPLIVEHNLGAMDAMKLSFKAAWSNIGGLIVLCILEFFILFAGALACLIGVFFVLPIIYAANVFAYRQVFPQAQENFQQNTPPPPSEYGMFGQGT